MTRIGLVGLGRMGQALLPRLVRSGNPVTVWNRSDKTAAIEAAGAIPAASPIEVVKKSDVVLSILFDDAAVETVYFGSSGLLSDHYEERIFVEMSTIAPQTVEKLSAAARARGAGFVDAPVCGSTAAAHTGALLVLAGGSSDVVHAVTPILNLFAHRIVHLGPNGRSMAAKLGVQLITYSYWLAVGEAVALASSAGLSAKEFLEILVQSPAALGALPGKIPAIAGDENGVAFSIASAEKDLDVVHDYARVSNIQDLMMRVVLERYRSAVHSGLGGRDIAAIVAFAAGHGKHGL